MTWTVGQSLCGDRYRIERKLGEGGFGVTYLVRDRSGHPWVVKTLNDTIQKLPDFDRFQQDFIREALRLAKCKHPHIVEIEDVFQEGPIWCMVLEYLEGQSLSRRVGTRQPIAESKALCYIQQIASALILVHGNGLLHRDIKPENIMVRSQGDEAVLIDFGIARDFTPNLTQVHTTFATDSFAPIEQYYHRMQRGAYTDVYALAATLYVLLTGELPAPAPARAAGAPLIAPRELNPRISPQVEQAIVEGMAFQAVDRPQFVQDWLLLLGVEAVAIGPNPAALPNPAMQQAVPKPPSPQPAKPIPMTGCLWWIGWMLANGIGYLASLIPLGLLNPAGSYMTWTFAISGMGLVIGFFQWLMLRQHFSQSRRWILATAIGFVTSALLVSLFSVMDPTWRGQGPCLVWFTGTAIGLMQWLFLRTRVERAGRWAWGHGIGSVIAGLFFAIPRVTNDPRAGSFFLMLLLLVHMTITGITMAGLLRHPK